jgi:hypothetical protein
MNDAANTTAKVFNLSFADQVRNNKSLVDGIIRNKYFPAEIVDETDYVAAKLIDWLGKQEESNRQELLANLIESASNNKFSGEFDLFLKKKLSNKSSASGVDKLAIIVGLQPMGFPSENNDLILQKIISKIIGLHPRQPFYERKGFVRYW